jgi:S-DNA-T family DNA segregation ATPase FtsK/SpoIIIE
MAVGSESRGLEDVRTQRGPDSRRAGRARGAALAQAQGQDRGARLLAEARWIALALAVLALAAALVSYHHGDPGYTHAAPSGARVGNWGGIAGAWAADLLYFLFGFSALLWVLFLGGWVLRGLLRLHGAGEPAAALSMWVRAPGFALLLVSAATLEALRLSSWSSALPGGTSGGVLGTVLAPWVQQGLGATAATVTLLVACAVGASLAFGFSWLSVAEHVGTALERAVAGLRAAREERQDRDIGETASEERAAALAARRERIEELEPVHIERGAAHAPASDRKQRESQVPLFAELAAPQSAGLPPLDLLDEAGEDAEGVATETLEFTSRLIEKKLKDFGVEVAVVAAYPGPVITRYEIEPATGVKGAQIVNLAKDLARALSLVSIRVVETIPGKNLMGLELPNSRRQVVRLGEILGSAVYAESHSPVTLGLGKDIAGRPVVVDLARMPHLLVAGTTGSGKSVGINAMILSILYKADPSQVRLIMIDPKMLELSAYEGIPHLLAPVITDMREAGHALNWCVAEMDRRYRLMSKLGVRSLSGYNQRIAAAAQKGETIANPFAPEGAEAAPLEALPIIVVVIDELADMMMVTGKKVEELIARIAQKARAAGMHLVLATQRPSVDVITGLIKANIPTRIAFQVSSRVDSRTILDQMGAESLLGQGDMLYLPAGSGVPTRVHGAFVSDAEVHRVVDALRGQGAPVYEEGVLDAPDAAGAAAGAPAEGAGGEADPLYDQAVEIVLKQRRASISLVQRHLRIGYNRAARLLEDMERAGLVSAMQANGNREILVPARETT